MLQPYDCMLDNGTQVLVSFTGNGAGEKLPVGTSTAAATLENSLVVLQNVKETVTPQPNSSTPRHLRKMKTYVYTKTCT